MPDQRGQHNAFLKEMIELRAVQNQLKNKLRKVLFSADKGKLCFAAIITQESLHSRTSKAITSHQ